MVAVLLDQRSGDRHSVRVKVHCRLSCLLLSSGLRHHYIRLLSFSSPSSSVLLINSPVAPARHSLPCATNGQQPQRRSFYPLRHRVCSFELGLSLLTRTIPWSN